MLTRTQRHRHTIETLARLTAAIELIGPASAALRDAQAGYPASTGGGSAPRLDAAGNPPGLDRYLTVPDPAGHDARRIDTILPTLNSLATELHSLLVTWGTPVTEQPSIERRASGGDCLACSRYCSGADGDRLRAGLCNACRMHWRRWQGENPTRDRGDWMLERRRTVAHEQEDVA